MFRVLAAVAFITALILVLVFIPGADKKPAPILPLESASGANAAEALPLCQDLQPTKLEFESIDTAYTQIKHLSIFREKADDPTLLSREMMVRTFQFISRPVPDWAHNILEDEQAAEKFRPAALSKRLYEELIKYEEYQTLTTLTGRNSYITASINALIKAIDDPFAYYFPPEEWLAAGRVEQYSGSYRGIGITLGKDERGEVVIQSVFAGSPAERAGLQVGDAIVLFNEKKVDSCSVMQLILIIKQLDDEDISLVLRKRGQENLERVHITLERIQRIEFSTCPAFSLPSERGNTSKGVGYFCPLQDRAKSPQDGILYISLRGFSTQVSQDLQSVFSTVNFEKVSGIIIDVRNNPGGLLDAVSNILDYFLSEDEVFYREEQAAYNPFLNRTDITLSSYRQNRYDIVPRDIPVVVLVGQDTFSAAELFAGAMQDHGRAILIGSDERTGGKGTVNLNIELAKDRSGSQGAIYIAIGFWKTPKGRNIELQDLDNDGYEEVGGLNPDVYVKLSDEDYTKRDADPAWYDPVIFAAIEYFNSQSK